MISPDHAAAVPLFEAFLGRMHLSRPGEVADIVAEVAASALGASDTVLLLANYEQTALVPVPSRLLAAGVTEQPIEGTVPGRCFIASAILTTPAQGGRVRVWAPLLNGTDRLGVLGCTVDAASDGGLSDDLMLVLERYGHVVAQGVLSKRMYGDVFHLVQRSEPMTVGAELLWSVLPPMTYATDGLVVSAMLEPAYSNGGDAFDYAVNGDCVNLAVLDGMGHGLAAAGVSTFAVAAYRHSRRVGLGLVDTYSAMDAAVREHFDGHFVTAVLAQLELTTGLLRWVSAGHPPPLLVRGGRVVKVLETETATPLGVPFRGAEVAAAQEQLEPGDMVLLYTDGVTEARLPDGSFLGVEGLVEFVAREGAAQLSAPETLRRLRHAVLRRQDGRLEDDATALLVEWRRGGERQLVPHTVLPDSDG